MEEEHVRRVVQEAVLETLTRLGFTVDLPTEMQSDMIYLRKCRQGGEEMQRLIRRSAVGVFISGVLFALWVGLKSIIKHQ